MSLIKVYWKDNECKFYWNDNESKILFHHMVINEENSKTNLKVSIVWGHFSIHCIKSMISFLTYYYTNKIYYKVIGTGYSVLEPFTHSYDSRPL